MKTVKIALYPGCFDPIHKQHIKIVQTIKKQFNFDKIWILINATSQEKRIIAPFSKRYQLVNNLLEKESKVEVKNKPIGFYTTTLIKKLKQLHPHYEFFLILGSDQIQKLDKWEKVKDLPKLVRFICAPRRGYRLKKQIIQKYQILQINNLKSNNFNSNEIKTGWNWKNLHQKTINQIIQDRLYFKYILNQQIKDQYRIQHCYNVANFTQQLANRFNYHWLKKDLYFAGLFHDITKKWSAEEHINFLKKHQLSSEILTKLPRPIWHSYTSAYFVKKELRVKTDNIINAIKHHSTAHKNFGTLEKIVFIADKLEHSKKEVVFQNIRQALNKPKNNLDNLFRLTLKAVIEKIENRNEKPTIESKEAYQKLT